LSEVIDKSIVLDDIIRVVLGLGKMRVDLILNEKERSVWQLLVEFLAVDQRLAFVDDKQHFNRACDLTPGFQGLDHLLLEVGDSLARSRGIPLDHFTKDAHSEASYYLDEERSRITDLKFVRVLLSDSVAESNVVSGNVENNAKVVLD